MRGRPEWADRGTWITTRNGREQVVEKPLTTGATTFIQTTDGQYQVRADATIEFFASEDGGI
jgi:hypothetical protein